MFIKCLVLSYPGPLQTNQRRYILFLKMKKFYPSVCVCIFNVVCAVQGFHLQLFNVFLIVPCLVCSV